MENSTGKTHLEKRSDVGNNPVAGVMRHPWGGCLFNI